MSLASSWVYAEVTHALQVELCSVRAARSTITGPFIHEILLIAQMSLALTSAPEFLRPAASKRVILC